MSWTSRRNLRSKYRAVFDSPQGESVLADLADYGCMMRPTYTPGDPHATSFSEGARSVVLRIFEYIDKDEAHQRALEARRQKNARQEMSDE